MATTRQRLVGIAGGSVGNLVEYYDWYVYSSFSLYFAQAFFPKGDQTAQLLSTAAIFAVGFLMRPVGGWLMGSYADRHGRKSGLALSVSLMCLGSLIIALVPGYDAIGVAAPVVLVLARMLQGLSLGGEYGTSATYLSEMATAGRRGFYSSFLYVTLVMGQLAALGVLIALQRTLGDRALHEWGWRIPFGIGAGLALVAMFLRRGLVESSTFTAHKAERPSPMKALRAYPREVLTVIGLTAGGTVAFYTYTTYMQKYLTNTAGFDKESATLINAASLFGFMLLQPVVGLLSDRIGRRPILIAFGVLGALCTVPLMTALGHARSVASACILSLTALAIVSGYTSINAVVKAELFPVHVRALGVAFPYALTVSVFGGSAEYLALWCKSRGHESWYFWYVAAMIGVSLVVYARMPDTRDRSRIEQ
jgi:MHS family alpha-ketoglutarate permease-like MFS transporter